MRYGFFLAVLALFMACSTTTPKQQDGGPNRRVDLSSIPDAVVTPVKRTAAGNKSPYTVLGKTYRVMNDSRGFRAEGTASWYGSKFHGRHTSNGEIFNMYRMTAAHKHLPIPTYAEVTNLNNGKKVIVRINDRGPFHGDRMIDLSWAAAAKLGFADKGTAPVRVVALDPDSGRAPKSTPRPRTAAPQPAPQQILPPPPAPKVPAPALLPENSYYQVAAMNERFGAAKMARDIEALTKYPVAIEWNESDASPVYKVLVGPIKDRREVQTLSIILELGGLDPGFVTQFDRANKPTDIEKL